MNHADWTHLYSLKYDPPLSVTKTPHYVSKDCKKKKKKSSSFVILFCLVMCLFVLLLNRLYLAQNVSRVYDGLNNSSSAYVHFYYVYNAVVLLFASPEI